MILDRIRPWHLMLFSVPFGIINWTNKLVKFGFAGAVDAMLTLWACTLLVIIWYLLEEKAKEVESLRKELQDGDK